VNWVSTALLLLLLLCAEKLVFFGNKLVFWKINSKLATFLKLDFSETIFLFNRRLSSPQAIVSCGGVVWFGVTIRSRWK
jgi:hypothetical protein